MYPRHFKNVSSPEKIDDSGIHYSGENESILTTR